MGAGHVAEEEDLLGVALFGLADLRRSLCSCIDVLAATCYRNIFRTTNSCQRMIRVLGRVRGATLNVHSFH